MGRQLNYKCLKAHNKNANKPTTDIHRCLMNKLCDVEISKNSEDELIATIYFYEYGNQKWLYSSHDYTSYIQTTPIITSAEHNNGDLEIETKNSYYYFVRQKEEGVIE